VTISLSRNLGYVTRGCDIPISKSEGGGVTDSDDRVGRCTGDMSISILISGRMLGDWSVSIWKARALDLGDGPVSITSWWRHC
jgi:hypothetical protein